MQSGRAEGGTHELDAPPWQRVESTLMATARLIREAYDARFATLDLNLTQASILVYVAEFGPITQTKIADHLGIGPRRHRLDPRPAAGARPASSASPTPTTGGCGRSTSPSPAAT